MAARLISHHQEQGGAQCSWDRRRQGSRKGRVAEGRVSLHRREDVNVFTFYQDLLPQIPNLSIAIRTILAHQPCTVDNERIFNIAGHVISLRRCRLTSQRAEMLILSAFRYRCRSRLKQPPRLLSFAIFDSKDVVLIAEAG